MGKARNTGSTIVFDMNGQSSLYSLTFSELLPTDIKATTIVLTIIGSLLTLASLVFSLSLLYDWINHLMRPKTTISQEKMGSSDLGTSMVTTGYQPCENYGFNQIRYGLVRLLRFPDLPCYFR